MRKSEILGSGVGAWVVKCDAEEIFALRHPKSGLWGPKTDAPKDGDGEWRLYTTYRSEEMTAGDHCYFWVSTDVAPGWPSGLWARCDVLGPPYWDRGGGPAWIDIAKRDEPRPYIPLRWHFLPHPVPKALVRRHPQLVDCELVKTPKMFNPAALRAGEVAVLERLIAGKPPSVPASTAHQGIVSSTARGGQPVKPKSHWEVDY